MKGMGEGGVIMTKFIRDQKRGGKDNYCWKKKGIISQSRQVA